VPTIVEAVGAADLAAVDALFREYAASLNVDLSYQDFARELASLPGDYAPPRGCLLLARDGDDPVACVAVRPLEGDACEMKRLYVRPAAQGSGLGRAMSLAAIGFARQAGYRAMRLDTLPFMRAAQSLYRQLGFREIAPYRFSPVEGNVYMELGLAEDGTAGARP
jgi:ribosomal protein S18 acetylase RimI-like enzyme